jgi:hypothetical protein
MQQHRRTDADGASLHRGNQRTARSCERLQETADVPFAMRTAFGNGGEFADVIASGEQR